MLWFDKKQQNSVKQLSFNKKFKKILTEKEGERKRGIEGGRERGREVGKGRGLYQLAFRADWTR